MKKLLILDADSLIWAVAYKFSEEKLSPEDFWMVENRCTLELKDILMKSGCHEFVGLMGSSEPVFRHKLALTAPYKGTRKEKPEWYVQLSPVIKKFLESKYGFQTVVGIEVDDAMSMIANTHKLESLLSPSERVDIELGSNTELILASKDKDMLQIEGKHYNYSTDTWLLVTEEQSEKNIWEQVLKGDSSDSVQGIPGIGAKKAETMLGEHPVERYPFIALAAYIKYFGIRVGALKFAEACNLLIMLAEGEVAIVPILNPFTETSEQELNDDIENAV